MRQTALAVIAALALQSIPGCSFLFMRRPPPLPVGPEPDVECTRSQTAPILDLSFTALPALALIGLCSPSSSPSSSSYVGPTFGHCDAGKAILGGVLMAAPWIASGIYGFHLSARCRAISADQAACRGGDATACSRLVPPPPVPEK